jgi:protein phosphatase
LLYKVRSASGQVCALKTLQPALADDRVSCEGLLGEEWLAKRLVSRHFPQVVPLPAPVRHHLYYVMTFHTGATLQQHLDSGRHFTVAEAAQIGAQVAKALGALHRLSIIHRDIKPANLLQGENGELRVLDMGVALAAGVPYPELQGNPGTPSYMAPELFDARDTQQRASAQSDLYAAGVTLYHLLTRKYPYGEIEPFQHPQFADPTPPTRYRPDIPQWLENVLLRAVGRDPKQRFETAEEMLLALERGEAQPHLSVRAPLRTPLTQRPAALWQAIALISIVLNLLLLYIILVR